MIENGGTRMEPATGGGLPLNASSLTGDEPISASNLKTVIDGIAANAVVSSIVEGVPDPIPDDPVTFDVPQGVYVPMFFAQNPSDGNKTIRVNCEITENTTLSAGASDGAHPNKVLFGTDVDYAPDFYVTVKSGGSAYVVSPGYSVIAVGTGGATVSWRSNAGGGVMNAGIVMLNIGSMSI